MKYPAFDIKQWSNPKTLGPKFSTMQLIDLPSEHFCISNSMPPAWVFNLKFVVTGSNQNNPDDSVSDCRELSSEQQKTLYCLLHANSAECHLNYKVNMIQKLFARVSMAKIYHTHKHTSNTDHEVHGSGRHYWIQARDDGQFIETNLWVGLQKKRIKHPVRIFF